MKAVVLIAALVLSGCAHMETTQETQYRNELNKWIGKDINLAFEMMGPPAETFRMPSGKTMYTWRTAGPETTVHASYFSRDRTKRCRTIFTATPEGIVDAIKSEGSCGLGKS